MIFRCYTIQCGQLFAHPLSIVRLPPFSGSRWPANAHHATWIWALNRVGRQIVGDARSYEAHKLRSLSTVVLVRYELPINAVESLGRCRVWGEQRDQIRSGGRRYRQTESDTAEIVFTVLKKLWSAANCDAGCPRTALILALTVAKK